MSAKATPKPRRDEGLDERRMTFSEHLDELRHNLIRSTVVVTLLLVVCWIFHVRVEHFVLGPYETVREQLEAEGTTLPLLTGVDMTEGFFFTVRVVFYGALLFGMPYVLFEMWRFVSAGLYPHERRAVMGTLPVSMVLFVMGAAFSYLVLVPISIKFMIEWPSPDSIKVEPRVDSYLSFFIVLTMMLGLVFQLPLLQVVLAKFGIIAAKTQAEYRRGFIMGAVITAAVITPTGDPVTMSLVALPMLVLYEIGLIIAKRITPRSAAPA